MKLKWWVLVDKSIMIYMPEIFGEANKNEPFISDELINRFKAENGCSVYIVQYKNDVYKDKIRVKLLANDIDFDIFFLELDCQVKCNF
jgi:hypothetical protein